MFRFFENLVDPYSQDPSDAPPPDRLGPFILRFLRPFRKVLIAALGFVTIGALSEVALIWYAGRLIDLLALSTPGELFADHGAELAGVAVFIMLIMPALRFTEAALLNQSVMPNLGTMMRWRAHRRMLKQSAGFFQSDFAGRIASRVMQTAPSMGEAAFQVLDALSHSAIYFIAALFLLADVDLRLAAPLAVWFVLYMCIMFWFTPKIGAASQAFSNARSVITGRIVDAYANIQTVKLFSHSEREEAFAKEAIEAGRRTFSGQMRLITGMDLSLILLNSGLIISVSALAVWLWTKGEAGPGAVAAAITLALRFSNMSHWIMWAFSSLFQNLGVIAEGMETISAPITLNDRKGAKPLSITGGAIRFEGLSHSYGRKDGGGLDGVDLDIRAGERIGLVGRSGAGKSTLVNLLLRFHEAEGGRVLIDDQDIRDVTQESLRAAIGMVTQDTSLLHRSVRDNIRYGRPEATEAEIENAARQVAAAEFIPELADPEGRSGYDAHVGERGVKLSGGQRQRIALARVVLKDAPILVLDEATSALDSEVEAAIEESLIGLMEGKTVIAIAHRLSTIARMDRIIVLEEGRVAESGTHQELLALKGLYARFWARQSGGFIGLDGETG